MFNPEIGGYPPKKGNEPSKIDETQEGKPISPELIENGIWSAYQSIKSMIFSESAEMIAQNDRKKSFKEPDYSDSVKDFAFRQLKPTADYLTEEQRQNRKRMIEAHIKEQMQNAKIKKNYLKDQKMEMEEEPPKLKLMNEFWQKELEIFNGIDGKNKKLREELLSFEQACRVVPDGPAKQLLIQQRDKLKGSVESKTSTTTDDLDGILGHEVYLRECYHPVGVNRHNMGLKAKLRK